MKTILTILAILLFSAMCIAEESSQERVKLRFDHTTICVPKEYVPGLSPFGQYLQDNVKGLDDSGQSQIIRLPAQLMVSGVTDYSFSHINKNNVDLEHEINGIANGMSEITGNPDLTMPCKDDFQLGYCYQRIVYKEIFYQYTMQTVEAKNKEGVREYLSQLFEKWESACVQNG